MDTVGEKTPVPVPKPRRHNNNTDANLNNKIAYENVSIDLINKNINIKDENIQNNSKNKLQTDKMFLMPNTSTTSNNNENNNSNNIGGSSSTSHSQILTNLNDLANAPVKNQKNASLDEVNKLSNIYNDDENVNVKPVPAPRRATSNTKQFNCTPSTGAINKKPTTIDINDFIESPKASFKSKSGKISGSYSFGNDDFDGNGDDSPKKFSLKKRESISSLSSSHSSSSITDGSKYHSASPGDSSGLSELALNKLPSNPPPSYEDVLKEDEKSANDRPNPIARTRKKSKTNSNVYENHEIGGEPSNKSGGSKRGSTCDEDDSDGYSLPCPNFPAPVLNEGIYGKIRSKDQDNDSINGAVASMQPPTRSRRRKESIPAENKEDELDGAQGINSNRATADSNEFPLEEKYAKLLSADLSEDLTEKLKLQESKIPTPSRSESWSYYDGHSDESSSSEPIYENERDLRNKMAAVSEPLYGVLYSEDDSNMLQPVAAARKRRSQGMYDQYAVVNKNPDVKLRNVDETKDILKEFDPLDRRTLDKILASKSNELKLLECILGSETYGDCANESNYEYHSNETSDGDDTCEEVPIPPERLDSLKECANEDVEAETEASTSKKDQNDSLTESSRRSVIVHQNVKLRSDSDENISKDDTNESNTSNTLEESTERASHSRWFLPSSLNKSDSKSKAKAENRKTYVEEIGEVLEDKSMMTPISKTSSMKSMFSNVMHKVEGIKRKTSFRSNANKNEVKTVLEMIPRPCLTQRLILHEGHLIRLPTGVVEDILKELHSRKAYIRDKKFQAYFDKDLKTPKENIPLETITTIQCVNNHKFTHNFVDIYCFEITTSISKKDGNNLSNPNMVITSNNSGNIKAQRVCHLYGVAKESERFLWMQKLLESMTDAFPPGFSSKFYRAGWCYTKNSITSTWSGTWILLQKDKRRLLFFNVSNSNLECMDLRKARCLVLKESDDSIKNLHVETGPTLMIDCPPYTVYFIMTSSRETKIWRHIIQEVAHNNGPSLKEQQLTKDDVPVLVDKCINFIYAHGSMSEGIYRKSGSENSIQKLLKQFRSDAYSVQIIRSDFNEHDVANVLKRFMRDLPDRLLGRCTPSLVGVAKMQGNREKIEAYKELLSRLPSIEYHSLRKLLGHLHFIQSQKAQNKMDYSNLAIVWGPTLLQEQNDTQQGYSQSSADVIVDLIRFHKHLYALSDEDITKEQLMLAVLQKYHAAAENLTDTMKKSGDLKVWITIDPNPDDEKEEKKQINVTLTPTKTVYDICKELAPKINREAYSVTLSEIILNGTLRRPLHHSEKVFDIVLKWSYWPEADRKDNFLRLTPMKFMKEVERALKVLPSVIPNKELKFADARTKSLKSYTLELTDHKITVMKKEKSQIVMVKEIDLKRTTAYLGCEKKRCFQLRWALTLIEDGSSINKTEKKERETPFIGHIIAGTNSNDQVVWYSSILQSLYGDNIMPSPEIILP
ncbi:uncharacterized protein LOC116343504 isoform X2 [Contarinia nasturtii]|uniref:uncharacterized protein LOC116343504 isoform X2 n=1 Tax=Contarinia nasturtii TaxID=265458 RepID=UPI0012D4343E|nr:uncharacterized protein LOC116343504 isoform X2 [Contarinia nasturtii]